MGLFIPFVVVHNLLHQILRQVEIFRQLPNFHIAAHNRFVQFILRNQLSVGPDICAPFVTAFAVNGAVAVIKGAADIAKSCLTLL